MKHDTNERMMYCPDCNQHEYPVLMPAVIVALNDILRLYQIFFARRMTYESTDRLLRTDGWMSDARAHRRKQLVCAGKSEGAPQ